MKKLTSALLLFITSFFILTSLNGCGDEDIINPLLVPVTNGAYILSEGTSPSNSRLSFYSATNDTFYQNIYNGNLSYPNGLELFNNDLYLVEQGAFGGPGRLSQLDSNGGVKFTSSAFGVNPYAIAIAGMKGYITNGPASKVSVMDLSNLTVIQDISVGVYPQEILFCNAKIFVCNTSAFGGNADSTISVIDPNTNMIIQSITLRKDPTSIISTQENNKLEIYVGCQGGGGMIYKIDPSTNNKLDSFNLPNGFDRDLAIYNNAIYFISASNNIDKLDLTSRTVTTFIANPGSPAFFYGYNIDVLNGRHYVLDAKNFSVEGCLYIYSSTGTMERTFTTGVGPRRVIFKMGSTSSGS